MRTVDGKINKKNKKIRHKHIFKFFYFALFFCPGNPLDASRFCRYLAGSKFKKSQSCIIRLCPGNTLDVSRFCRYLAGSEFNKLKSYVQYYTEI